MISLDEAIRHAEEQADLLEESAQGCDLTDKVEQEIACKSGKCAEEHRQLAEWLKDYKRLLEQIEDIKAEITEYMNDCATTSVYTRLGFQTSLNVIDKHIGGKEQSE